MTNGELRMNLKPQTIKLKRQTLYPCWRGYSWQGIQNQHSTRNVKSETINACILPGFILSLFTTEELKLGYRPRKPGCTSVSGRLFLWYFFWRNKKSTISDLSENKASKSIRICSLPRSQHSISVSLSLSVTLSLPPPPS